MASGDYDGSQGPPACEVISQDFLCCTLCHESFRDPRLLPCLHTFCAECLEKFASELEHQQVKDQDEVKRDELCVRLREFPCPECDSNIEVPDGGVQEFPNNSFMDSLQGAVAGQQRIAEEQRCTSCEEGDLAVMWCHDCNTYLCDECHSAHARFRAMRVHKVYTLEEMRDMNINEYLHQKPLFCMSHPDEVLKFYCTECGTAVCRDCKITAHDGHKAEEITVAAEGVRGQIAGLLTSLDQASGMTANQLEGLKQHSTQYETDLEGIIRNVQKQVDYIHDLVHKFSQQLIEDLDRKSCSAEKDMKSEREALEDKLLSLQTCNDFLHAVLTHSSDAELIANKNQLLQHLNLLRKHEPTCNVKRCKLEYHVDYMEDEFRKFLGRVTAHNITVPSEERGEGDGNVAVDHRDGSPYQRRSPPRESHDSSGSDAGTYSLEEGASPCSSPTPQDYPELKTATQTKFFRTRSSSEDQFDAVTGLSVTSSGEIVVADYGNGKVKVFNKYGQAKWRFGPPSNIQKPWDVKALPDGHLMVTDYRTKDARIFTMLGQFVRRFAEFVPDPSGIAVRKNGDIIITNVNSINKAVIIFNNSGEEVFRIEDAKLQWPRYVAVNVNDDIIVSDIKARCVIAFTPDGKQKWQYVVQKGVEGVCCDKHGHVIISDRGSNRIHLLTADGHFRCYLLTQADGLDNPKAIAIDRDGQLVVGQRDGMVKIFRYLNKR